MNNLYCIINNDDFIEMALEGKIPYNWHYTFLDRCLNKIDKMCINNDCYLHQSPKSKFCAICYSDAYINHDKNKREQIVKVYLKTCFIETLLNKNVTGVVISYLDINREAVQEFIKNHIFNYYEDDYYSRFVIDNFDLSFCTDKVILSGFLNKSEFKNRLKNYGIDNIDILTK